MVRASASQLVGRGFEPRLSHAKDFTNGAHCLLVWRSTYENGVGKKSHGATIGPAPAVAFTAFADAWPKAIETEIGTTLCAIGRGKGL